jgi:hypothetical protein
MPSLPSGLTDEKANRVLVGLRDGRTLREFSVKPSKFDQYCEANPHYALEARPLVDANSAAALKRKGALAARTHCKNGHSLKEAFVRVYRGWTIRACKICERLRRKRGGILTPEVVASVKTALQNGTTVNQIIHGNPVGGGAKNRSLRIADASALARYRRENPDFDRFVVDAVRGNSSRGQRIRYSRVHTAQVRDSNNEYYKIRALIPEKNPHRDDIVARIFEDLLGGALRREDLPARIKVYISEFNRLFPTKYAKFGDNLLVSLDEVLFDDGSTTRGDTVTRGLWD